MNKLIEIINSCNANAFLTVSQINSVRDCIRHALEEDDLSFIEIDALQDLLQCIIDNNKEIFKLTLPANVNHNNL
jgi:hypothetical protein